MEAKYIVGELPAMMGSVYGAIIFPPFMEHAQVARALDIDVASAGMCAIDDSGKWYAYGKSQSLGVESHPDDDKQLNKLGKL